MGPGATHGEHPDVEGRNRTVDGEVDAVGQGGRRHRSRQDNLFFPEWVHSTMPEGSCKGADAGGTELSSMTTMSSSTSVSMSAVNVACSHGCGGCRP